MILLILAFIFVASPCQASIIFSDNFDTCTTDCNSCGDDYWDQWVTSGGCSATYNSTTHYSGELAANGRNGTGRAYKIWRHSTSWPDFSGGLVKYLPGSYHDIWFSYYIKIPTAMGLNGGEYCKWWIINPSGGEGVYLDIMGWEPGAGYLVITNYNIGGTSTVTVLNSTDTAAILDGQWHNLQFHFNNTTQIGTLQLYVDGTLKYNNTSYDWGSTAAWYMLQHFHIGNRGSTTVWQNSWQAMEIDDFKMATTKAETDPDGGSDTTAPTLSTATIASDGTTLTLAFSESVQIGSHGDSPSHFSISPSGGAATVTYASGSGTSSLVYTISRTIQYNETVTLTYTQPGNGIEDTSSNLNDLATISSPRPVTNNSTQGAPDTTPDPFSFTDVTGASLSTVYTSNTITVTGINASTTVSITGGTYSKNGGAYTASAGTAVLGDTFSVRQTSSSSNSTTTNTVLTIGGVSDTYSVTTVGTGVTLLLNETFDDPTMPYDTEGWGTWNSSIFVSSPTSKGSGNSVQFTFPTSSYQPTGVNNANRWVYTTSDTLYISFYWRFNSDWVGSGQSYHPHLIYILNALDTVLDGGQFRVYIETTGSVSGYEGLQPRIIAAHCPTSSNCGPGGGLYEWYDVPGYYFSRNTWHHVECYFVLNTVGSANGQGTMWIDGVQVFNSSTITFRSGATGSSTHFGAIAIGPWISDGSPQNQTMWMDEMLLYDGIPTDAIAPAVVISTTDPSSISTDSLSVSGTAYDAVWGTGSVCKWRLDEAPSASYGTTISGLTYSGTVSWSFTGSGFHCGSNTLYVGCEDGAGYWGNDSMVVNFAVVTPVTGLKIK